MLTKNEGADGEKGRALLRLFTRPSPLRADIKSLVFRLVVTRGTDLFFFRHPCDLTHLTLYANWHLSAQTHANCYIWWLPMATKYIIFA